MTTVSRTGTGTPQFRHMAGGAVCRGISADNRVNRSHHRRTGITGRIGSEVMTGVTTTTVLTVNTGPGRNITRLGMAVGTGCLIGLMAPVNSAGIDNLVRAWVMVFMAVKIGTMTDGTVAAAVNAVGGTVILARCRAGQGTIALMTLGTGIMLLVARWGCFIKQHGS